jgi:hypothetical protein
MVKAVAKPNEVRPFSFSAWRHLASCAAAKGEPRSYCHSIIREESMDESELKMFSQNNWAISTQQCKRR